MKFVPMGECFKKEYLSKLPAFATIIRDGMEMLGTPTKVTVVDSEEEYETILPQMIAVGELDAFPLYLVPSTTTDIKKTICGEEEIEIFIWTIWEPKYIAATREEPEQYEYDQWYSCDSWHDMVKQTLLYQAIKKIENYVEGSQYSPQQIEDMLR
jgi:hypothetical protein